LPQTTLSADDGVSDDIWWELMQDISAFSAFAIYDLIRAVQILEDVTRSGLGQPQGLAAEGGHGQRAATAFESTAAYLIDATFDVLATLKAAYYPGAAWIRSRGTGVG
jgi:hypothetical protein